LATPTYDLLDSTTLASAASSVTFTSIDQSYGDLVLSVQGSGKSPSILINNNTNPIYNEVSMEGDNQSGAGSLLQTNNQQFFVGFPSYFTLQNSLIMQFFDYAANDKHKSTLARTQSGAFTTIAVAGRFASTSAITSIQVTNADQWTVGTVFSLYGIAK